MVQGKLFFCGKLNLAIFRRIEALKKGQDVLFVKISSLDGCAGNLWPEINLVPIYKMTSDDADKGLRKV